MTEIISFGMTGREILSLRNSQLLLTQKEANFLIQSLSLQILPCFTLWVMLGEIFTAGAWATQKCLQRPQVRAAGSPDFIEAWISWSACESTQNKPDGYWMGSTENILSGIHWDPQIPAPGPAQGSPRLPPDSSVQNLLEFWQERYTEEMLRRKLSQEGHYNLLLD